MTEPLVSLFKERRQIETRKTLGIHTIPRAGRPNQGRVKRAEKQSKSLRTGRVFLPEKQDSLLFWFSPFHIGNATFLHAGPVARETRVRRRETPRISGSPRGISQAREMLRREQTVHTAPSGRAGEPAVCLSHLSFSLWHVEPPVFPRAGQSPDSCTDCQLLPRFVKWSTAGIEKKDGRRAGFKPKSYRA